MQWPFHFILDGLTCAAPCRFYQTESISWKSVSTSEEDRNGEYEKEIDVYKKKIMSPVDRNKKENLIVEDEEQTKNDDGIYETESPCSDEDELQLPPLWITTEN